MSDTETTPVVFRVWMDKQASSHGIDVFALFPTVFADNTGDYCSSYQHIGQHGTADYYHCINKSRPATPDEYADLKTELEDKGYTLRVIQRANYQHHKQRRATVAALGSKGTTPCSK